MVRHTGLAVGAGVASAMLFIVSASASLAAMTLAYLTPLPIIIAALGFGHVSGVVAAIVGSVSVGLLLGPLPGCVFLVIMGLPAWWLAYLTLLARSQTQQRRAVAAGPVISADQTGANATGGGPEWYPIPSVVTWIALLAAAAVLLVGLLLMTRFGGFAPTVSSLAGRLSIALGDRDAIGGFSMTELVLTVPVVMAASIVLMLSFNLWLGGRVVLMSQRLPRPWPTLADNLRLPKAAVAVLGGLLLLALMPDPFGLAARVVAAALGMTFVFEGLATAHVLTRGLMARRLILASIYAAVVLLMPYPLIALALIGCIDSIFALRGKTLTNPPLTRS